MLHFLPKTYKTEKTQKENKIEQNNTNYELNEYKLGLSPPSVRIFCEILTDLAKITYLSLTPKLRHFGL
jgi:hypothetical protein